MSYSGSTHAWGACSPGSIPGTPTFLKKIRACSSSGRALHSHCRGKGFESPQVHKLSGCGIKAIIHASGACDPSSILGSPTVLIIFRVLLE